MLKQVFDFFLVLFNISTFRSFSQNVDSDGSSNFLKTVYSTRFVEGQFEIDFEMKTSAGSDTFKLGGICLFDKTFLNDDSVASFIFFENEMLTLILYNNEYIDINNSDSSFEITSFESVGKSARGIKSRAVFWDYLKASNLSTY